MNFFHLEKKPIFAMNQSERIPSNVSSYASLTIRKRRNNRRVRHRITIDTIRVRRLPTQITNNSSINQFFNGIAFP